MLSAAEYMGLKSILDDTDDDDLYSILDTVTSGARTADTRTDAVRLILANTNDPSNLLRRQKVTKRVLVNYLEREGVSGPSSLGKQDLVQTCLQMWGSQGSFRDAAAVRFSQNYKCTVSKGAGTAKKKGRKTERYDDSSSGTSSESSSSETSSSYDDDSRSSYSSESDE